MHNWTSISADLQHVFPSGVVIGIRPPDGTGSPSYTVPEEALPSGNIRICTEISDGGLEAPITATVTLSTVSGTAMST